MSADLQPLADRRQAELGGDRAAVPFHERGADLENLVAVEADHLRDLRGRAAGVGQVEFLAAADVHLAQQGAFGHDRQGAVNRGAGDGIVHLAGMVEQLLGREMLLLGEGRLENRQPLVGDAQAFRVRKWRNFSRAADRLTGKLFEPRGGGVNLFVTAALLVCHAAAAPAVIRLMIVGVHPLAGFDKLLHYKVPENLRAGVAVGTLVRMPVLNTLRLGLVGEIGAPKDFPSSG
jgi:hypothetical protein